MCLLFSFEYAEIACKKYIYRAILLVNEQPMRCRAAVHSPDARTVMERVHGIALRMSLRLNFERGHVLLYYLFKVNPFH